MWDGRPPSASRQRGDTFSGLSAFIRRMTADKAMSESGVVLLADGKINVSRISETRRGNSLSVVGCTIGFGINTDQRVQRCDR